jgi:hypothetical protein
MRLRINGTSDMRPGVEPDSLDDLPEDVLAEIVLPNN